MNIFYKFGVLLAALALFFSTDIAQAEFVLTLTPQTGHTGFSPGANQAQKYRLAPLQG